MSWVKMDDGWPFNRKLRQVEPTDRLMWAMAIAYASSQNSDGYLDGAMVEMVAFLAGVTKPYEALERLVAARLLVPDAGRWSINNYLEFNYSAAQRAHLSEIKAEAGRRGGHRKAGTVPSSVPSSVPADSQANAEHVAKQTSSRPVPSSPVPSRVEKSVSQSGGPGDQQRVRDALALVVEGLTELYDVTPAKRVAYRSAILRNPDEHVAALNDIAKAMPAADGPQLAAAYLAHREHPAAARSARCGICRGEAHPNGPGDCPQLA
jgi:hypothetical protein